MFVQHIAHGLLIVSVVFFGLPAILSFAINTIVGTRFSFSLALRYLSRGLHVIIHGVSLVSDAVATGIADQFPDQTSWLKPLLKPTFTALFLCGGLYLISILTSR